MPKFVKAALSGEPLTIYGDGEQTRDFTYVRDVVDANLKAAGKSGVYNVAGGKQTKIIDLAHAIIRLTDSKSEIKLLPERAGDIKHSLADISKAKRKLDWEPKYSLEEGLKEYIDYFSKL
jgi:UDP-glucose 4-epimerase